VSASGRYPKRQLKRASELHGDARLERDQRIPLLGIEEQLQDAAIGHIHVVVDRHWDRRSRVVHRAGSDTPSFADERCVTHFKVGSCNWRPPRREDLNLEEI
jgi:hypothetical protein